MISRARLTSRQAVDEALDEFDDLGRIAFLHKYGFGEAKDYFLITDSGAYDSKPIFAAAYEREHGVRLTNEDFSGGRSGAGKWLSDLGYTIQGMEPKEGRLVFDSFEAAMDAFKLAVENMTAARKFVATRDFEEFYLPPSRSYIAMIPRGGSRPSAWVNKGYVWFRNEDGRGEGIAFPRNSLRDGGRSARQRRREEAESRICQTCAMVLPASGICSYC